MKKLLSAVLSVLMISSTLFAGAISAEITETADETADGTQIVSEAVLAAEDILPGINLLTGKKAKYDFEDGNITSLISPVIGKDASLYFTTVSNGVCILNNTGVEAKHYANLKLNLTNTVPAGRKLAIVTDTYGETSDGAIFSDLLYAYIGGSQNKTPVSAAKSGGWKTVWFVRDAAESSYTLKDGQGTFFQYGGHTGTGETYFYDNVGVYPLYKVNYYGADNATVIATDWVLLDNNGELLDSFEPSLPSDAAAPEKSGFGLAGWSQTPNSAVSESSVALENKDIDLYPVFGKAQAKEGDPGINLLTGNADVLDFDNYGLSNKVNTTRKPTFKNVTIGENKVLMACDKNYPILYSETTVEKARPVYFTVKALKLRPDGLTGNNSIIFAAAVNKNEGIPARRNLMDIKTVTSAPSDMSEFVTYFGEAIPYNDKNGTFGYDHYDDTARFNPYIQIQKLNTPADGECVYLDDIGMYPYYKATYHLGANNTVDSYFLLDDNGEFLTEYTPVLPEGSTVTPPGGKKLVGWSTQENSDTAENTVALENADIELYPVFGKAQAKEGDPGINLLTGNADVLDFDSYELSDKADIKSRGNFAVESIDGNNVLKAYGNTYPILFANTKITKERPIYFKLKALKYIPSDVAGENTNTLVAGLVQTKGSGDRITTAGMGLTTTDKIPTSAAELKTVSAVTVKFDKYDSVEADVPLYPEIQIQKITNTDSVCVYLDDIGMYPYYKATYHLGENATADSYFLLDDNGEFLTEYTPVLPEGSTVTVPDGKKLVGWSTQENSDTAENTVALENADIELYPVFADADYAPHWYNDASDVKEITDIRVQKDDGGNVINDKSGLRFKSYITDENKLDAALTEYGFIVALTEKLGQAELTHSFTYDGLAEGKKAFIAQPSFVKGTQTNLYLKYDHDNALTVFSCVLVNIPVSHYNDSFTVRAYSKVNGEYVYGTAMRTSILDILNHLCQNGNEVQKANAEILLSKYNASLGA